MQRVVYEEGLSHLYSAMVNVATTIKTNLVNVLLKTKLCNLFAHHDSSLLYIVHAFSARRFET